MGDAGAEGDEDFLVVLQEKPGRQFALQPRHGFYALGLGGFRQHNHEFLAAVARQHVLRPQGRARDVGQMHQGGVARVVPQAVIDGLEVVHVQQGYAQRRTVAPRACDLSLHDFVQAFAVEGAGQWVVACQGAGAVEFVL